MKQVGAIPWLVLHEDIPRPPYFDAEGPLKAYINWSTNTICYRWFKESESYNLLDHQQTYQLVALGVVADILSPIVWKELERYIQINPGDIRAIRYVRERAPEDAIVVEDLIALLREGEPLYSQNIAAGSRATPQGVAVFRLSNLLNSFDIQYNEEPVTNATLSVMAWSNSLTEIFDVPSYTRWTTKIESALIPIAYYFYYDVMKAPGQPDFEVSHEIGLPFGAQDRYIDIKYFVHSLNWAIWVWWKEFMDAVAFRR